MSATHTFKKILITGSFVVFTLAAGTAFAGWAPPSSGPVSEPSGPTAQDNFYHPLTTNPAGQQEKVGRLGIVSEPDVDYDFRIDGIGSFLGGIWASSGVFLNTVCIGTPTTATADCPGTGNASKLDIYGTFKSLGGGANIQNDNLTHSTALGDGSPGLERVCSDAQGVLRLCSSGVIASGSTTNTNSGGGSGSNNGPMNIIGTSIGTSNTTATGGNTTANGNGLGGAVLNGNGTGVVSGNTGLSESPQQTPNQQLGG